jgi:hypothetical protein
MVEISSGDFYGVNKIVQNKKLILLFLGLICAAAFWLVIV